MVDGVFVVYIFLSVVANSDWGASRFFLLIVVVLTSVVVVLAVVLLIFMLTVSKIAVEDVCLVGESSALAGEDVSA